MEEERKRSRANTYLKTLKVIQLLVTLGSILGCSIIITCKYSNKYIEGILKENSTKVIKIIFPLALIFGIYLGEAFYLLLNSEPLKYNNPITKIKSYIPLIFSIFILITGFFVTDLDNYNLLILLLIADYAYYCFMGVSFFIFVGMCIRVKYGITTISNITINPTPHKFVRWVSIVFLYVLPILLFIAILTLYTRYLLFTDYFPFLIGVCAIGLCVLGIPIETMKTGNVHSYQRPHNPYDEDEDFDENEYYDY